MHTVLGLARLFLLPKCLRCFFAPVGPSSGEFVAPSAPEVFTTLTFGAGPLAPLVTLTFEIRDDLVALESPENFNIMLNTSDSKRIRVGGTHTVVVGDTIEVFAAFREVSVTIQDDEGKR